MYMEDKLAKYIEESELRIFSKDIKVRLSKELAQKYDSDYYKAALDNYQVCFNKIKKLNIVFPSNANPVFYIYIVPMDNYSELLQMPKEFDDGTGGRRPVGCFDIDGFNVALGLSENRMEMATKKHDISAYVNDLHEIIHIVHEQFWHSNQCINEGLAEAVPLYVMGLENEFTEHKEVLSHLTINDIYTAHELLNQEYNKTFGKEEAVPNNTCSFRLSYISSYLFVRGCLETIVKSKKCTKEEAVQKFLEILRSSRCINEWLIFDIANAIGLDKDNLLDSKDLQLQVLNEIINE